MLPLKHVECNETGQDMLLKQLFLCNSTLCSHSVSVTLKRPVTSISSALFSYEIRI